MFKPYHSTYYILNISNLYHGYSDFVVKMSYQNNPILFDCNTFSIYDVPIVKEYNLMTIRIDKNEQNSGIRVQLTSGYYSMHAMTEVSFSI